MKKVSTELKRVLFIFATLYLVLMAFMFFKQRAYIYFPDTNRPDRAFYKAEDMDVIRVETADGLTLEGWYKAPAAPGRPVVLLFHGNGGHIGIRSFKARLFIDEGYGVLLAEYRGYGGNEGLPTEKGLYEDARAYYRWLTNDAGISARDIVVYGESLGTAVAVMLAAEQPDVKALVLETPFTSLAAVAQRHMYLLPTYVLLTDRYNSAARIRNVRAPVLVFHGTADRVVPYSFGEALYNAAPGVKRLETYPGGNHINLYEYGAAAHILDFIRNLEAGTPE